MKVTLIKRKAHAGQFSIEQVFSVISESLIKHVELVEFILPYSSQGILSRIKNILAVSKLESDIYHITGDVNYVALALPRGKTIVTVHDCEFLSRSTGIKKVLLKWIWLSWPLGHVRKITTISNASKQELLKLVQLDPDKIMVIHNPITITESPPKSGHTNQPDQLLHIGTKTNKNLSRLMEAIEGMNVTLHIVGKLSPQQLNELEDRHITYQNHVNISNEALKALYLQADLLCFLSTSEGFGLPIIEANVLGCPVITSNLSAMPEIAGDAALLVDPYSVDEIRNGIEQLLSDSLLRAELIKKGKANILRFKPDHISDQYLAFYQSLT